MTVRNSKATYLTLSAPTGNPGQSYLSNATLQTAEYVGILRGQKRWYQDEIERLQDLSGIHVDPRHELTALSLRSRVAELDWVLETLFGVK